MGTPRRLAGETQRRPAAPDCGVERGRAPGGITGGACPQRRDDVYAEPLPDDSLVLYDPRTHVAHALSASAGVVWSWCDGAHDPPAIAQALAATYDAPVARILANVETLLQALHAAGLLTVPGDAGSD